MASGRIMVFGATGTIGRATVKALIAAGYTPVCMVRDVTVQCPETLAVEADVTNPDSLAQAMQDQQPDAIISCLASRTGGAKDAWAIDYQAHRNILDAAKSQGVTQFVLLSALCVQRPMLEFQKAKLAFEEALQTSGLMFSIVRPTAFFKSVSGQFDRVMAGKPFLMFGDGALTACKPISDRDLGTFLVSCLTEPSRQNQVLPIGGPGPAQTPKEQGEALFHATGKTPHFQKVPVALMNVIIGILTPLGWVSQKMADRAEFARIGKYYGTQSMLVWNEATCTYDADATPEYGSDTLAEFYAQLAAGKAQVDLRDHAAF